MYPIIKEKLSPVLRQKQQGNKFTNHFREPLYIFMTFTSIRTNLSPADRGDGEKLRLPCLTIIVRLYAPSSERTCGNPFQFAINFARRININRLCVSHLRTCTVRAYHFSYTMCYSQRHLRSLILLFIYLYIQIHCMWIRIIIFILLKWILVDFDGALARTQLTQRRAHQILLCDMQVSVSICCEQLKCKWNKQMK